MKILGLSYFYHDSAVALVEDGKLLYSLNEERISRQKQDPSFPLQALNEGLEFCGWSLSDIDLAAFYETPRLKLERLEEQLMWDYPHSFRLYSKYLPEFKANKLNIDAPLRKAGYTGNIELFEHHYSHAASVFYTSPFKEALVVTIDGVGEWDCLAVYQGSEEKFEKVASIRFPNSLGLFYSVFTNYLGFRVNSGEYKVMGLACYGEPTLKDKILQNVIHLNDDGSFWLDNKYFNFSDDKMQATKALTKLIGMPKRVPESEITQEHFNLGASVQAALEEALYHIIGNLLKKYQAKNLCLAGGVALNCTANTKLIKTFGCNLYIQPASGDAGGALGAALAAQVKHSGETGLRLSPLSPYQGKQFSDQEIEDTLTQQQVKFVKSADITKDIAEALDQGKIVAVHQGRDEWGPRALGNRSILANPTIAGMQDHLNAKIKFRESFRPFAPVCLAESFSDYFDGINMAESPYMLYTFKVKQPDKIPAATHIDGTGRAQTVTEEQNPHLYNIINKFAKLSGVPVIINTSFNLRGEPIVHTPADALKTFNNSGIDCLAISDYFITKE